MPYTDELIGGPAEETVLFGIDGEDYEVELSSTNAEKLRQVFEPFIAAARKVENARWS